MTSGKASREFSGKLNPGITSRTLPRKMKKNSVDSRGSQPSPSGPIIWIRTCSRTNCNPDSMISWSLPGIILGFRNAATNRRTWAANAITSSRMMKLKQIPSGPFGPMQPQMKSFVVGCSKPTPR